MICGKKSFHRANITTLCIGIVFVCIVTLMIATIIIPGIKYHSAMQLLNSGNYSEAATMFNSIKYKDSDDKALECIYTLQKSELKTAKVGEIVKFGLYEQDNIKSNGREEIKWRVIAIDGDKAFVVSEYGLDCRQYNSTDDNITWERCSLRSWLNDEFLNSAFGEQHQSLIEFVNVSADENPQYTTDPGNDTIDRIFLLSISEANGDYPYSKVCEPTEYALSKRAKTYQNDYEKRIACYWWLRTPGKYQHYVANVDSVVNFYGTVGNYDLSVMKFGNTPIADGNYCIRPAMWININDI